MWEQVVSTIRNKRELFLGGGGVKTLSFIGALETLGPVQWRQIHGVSAGAILGLLLVLGHTPYECLRVFLEYEHVLMSCLSLGRLCQGESPCDPKVIRQTVAHMLARKGFAADTTLATLASRRSTRLGIIAFCVETSSLVNFTALTHPQMSVCDALTSSVALPVLFPPVRFDNSECSYYDAGIISSAPLALLDPLNTFAIIVRLLPGESASGFPETAHLRCCFRTTMAVEYAQSKGMAILQVPPLSNGMTLLTRGHNSPCACMNMGIICFALYAIRAETAGLLILMLCCRSFSGRRQVRGLLA